MDPTLILQQVRKLDEALEALKAPIDLDEESANEQQVEF